MRFSKEEALREVQRRESALRRKKFRREMPLLSLASLSLTAAVTFVLFSFHKEANGGITAGPHYGTLLFNDGIGGYVLAVVAAFMAGVVITLLCIRHQQTRFNKRKRE